ncbi:nuclear pore complex component-domain-containing protein [Limtongia smithiae]|uniref:nuclear pore complex component-domain-containing protein n=1 Tax=Limtongia smithiae TaxID=1125753 RepID=UPI0034CFC84B
MASESYDGSPATPAPYSQSPFKSLYTPSPPRTSSPLSPQTVKSANNISARSRMQNNPSTPVATARSAVANVELPTASLVATPKEMPTGKWRHPAFDDINSRVDATEFTQTTSRKMALNLLAWITYLVFVAAMRSWPWMQELMAENEKFSRRMTYIGIALQLLFVWNIADGLIRLIKPRDKLADVPLTPSQRKLMGLDEYVKTSSPSQPLTPPKYVKSYPSSRESPRSSPLLKKSLHNLSSSPQTPQNGRGGPAQVTPTRQLAKQKEPQTQPQPKQSPSTLPLSGTPGATGFTPGGRYMYNLTDSPGRKNLRSS